MHNRPSQITGLYGVLALSIAFLAQLLGQSLVKVAPFHLKPAAYSLIT
jgi:hypothetical protein